MDISNHDLGEWLFLIAGILALIAAFFPAVVASPSPAPAPYARVNLGWLAVALLAFGLLCQ